MTELRCPSCGTPVAEVKVNEEGNRTGFCRNPACQLNRDGIGFVAELMGAVVSLRLPTQGPRLQEMLDILGGRAPASLTGIAPLEGKVWCGCGIPLLKGQDGNYYHIQDLPRKRLKELLHSEAIVDQIHSWLSELEFICPECGPKPNPFKEMPRGDFAAHVATGVGVKDLYGLIQEVVGHYVGFSEHPAVAEAERIIREEPK